ncbi:MBL fold metallo-hydrolase [Pseudogemmobacter sonorensis]|uniref:MBL fold metallo-hydrolase n=1 Tax=Pseudogemmobacter sonorensis TaxID=2989681 RepID=UPI0036811E54
MAASPRIDAKMAGRGLSRRQALTAVAALPAAALAAGAGAPAARAQAAPAGDAAAARFGLGGFSVTSLLAGTRILENPHGTFGTDVAPEAFAAAAEAAFLPVAASRNFFTPVLVETGSESVLFDTGLDADGLGAALALAGVAPEAVTLVVLSHMHGDHIGGLTGAGGAAFLPNARYATGRVEFDHWAAQANEGFEAKVRPLAERMTFLEDGDQVLPGITALAAAGHTPGHMIFHLEDAGRRLMLTADTANHYVFSLAHPDWEVRFDADKAAAAATRRRVFDQIAAERIPFVGYHMPFPGLGYVEPQGEGFRFVPHSYQLTL